MLNPNWAPTDLKDIQSEVAKLRVQVKSDLPVDEVIRMQLEVLMFASGLTQTVNEARWYEAKCVGESKRAYTDAFLLSEGSDRKRDAEAKKAGPVRIAEAKSQEAEVYRKLLEDTKQDFIAIHYALRAMLRDKTEEKKYGY
jgi:hypothetical protein